jgi:hypothetical protein
MASNCGQTPRLARAAARWALMERLEFELGVISEMGFESYFLIVWDFVGYAKRERLVDNVKDARDEQEAVELTREDIFPAPNPFDDSLLHQERESRSGLFRNRLIAAFGGDTVFPWNADYTPLRTAHW